MKLLLDEMWSQRIAIQLRGRGHEVVAVAELSELRSRPDEAIFAFAQTGGYALVTENVADFSRLSAFEFQLGRSHFGLIFTDNRRFPRRDPRTIGRLITSLDDLLSQDLNIENQQYWLH